MNQKSKGTCNDFRRRVQRLDIYGEHFQFALPNHQWKQKSIVGAILTILCSIVIIVVAGTYLKRMVVQDDVNIVRLEQKDYYYDNTDSEVSLSANDDDFIVLIQFTESSDEITWTFFDNYSDYGTLSVKMKEYGGDEIVIETRPCDDADAQFFIDSYGLE